MIPEPNLETFVRQFNQSRHFRQIAREDQHYSYFSGAFTRIDHKHLVKPTTADGLLGALASWIDQKVERDEPVEIGTIVSTRGVLYWKTGSNSIPVNVPEDLTEVIRPFAAEIHSASQAKWADLRKEESNAPYEPLQKGEIKRAFSGALKSGVIGASFTSYLPVIFGDYTLADYLINLPNTLATNHPAASLLIMGGILGALVGMFVTTDQDVNHKINVRNEDLKREIFQKHEKLFFEAVNQSYKIAFSEIAERRKDIPQPYFGQIQLCRPNLFEY